MGKSMKIFELLNDRGRSLTNLESLKCYVMNAIYIKASESNIANEKIDNVKDHFKNIYKYLNDINKYNKNIDEDTILRYYFIANGEWKDKEFYNTKDKIKLYIDNVENVTKLEELVDNIKDTYENMKLMLEKIYKENSFGWLTSLYILAKMTMFYPLLIEINKKDNNDEFLELVCNYLELFVYRVFGIMNKKSNTGEGRFYSLAREIGKKEELDQNDIIDKLKKILIQYSGKNSEKKFKDMLTSNNFYHDQSGIDGRYLLIKYEGKLVNEKSKEFSMISKGTIFLDSNNKESLTVEHIVAQETAKNNDHYTKELINKSKSIYKDLTGKDKQIASHYFYDNYLNHIANLVISTKAGNSSKGDKLPEDKDWEGFKSQKEIGDIIHDEKFDFEYIVNRGNEIEKFATEYWSYEYFEKKYEDSKIFDIKNRKPFIK